MSGLNAYRDEKIDSQEGNSWSPWQNQKAATSYKSEKDSLTNWAYKSQDGLEIANAVMREAQAVLHARFGGVGTE